MKDEIRRGKPHQCKVKCVVWDLDETVWTGNVLENLQVQLKPDVVDVIRTLDRRGILHSVASRGDHATAMQQLERFGLAEYFLCPQISWNPKSESMARIASVLGIDVNSLAFVDDQAFEREEVRHSYPHVLCFDAAEVSALPQIDELNPTVVGQDTAERRQKYLLEAQRRNAEERYRGSKEEFLSTLEMRFEIVRCKADDLSRAEELTVRTNQMNATGYTYSCEELAALANSTCHLLLLAGLEDRFGSYGRIGLALVDMHPAHWTIKLLLMSCRVVSRGVGTILLSCIMNEAKSRGVRLQAEFRPNSRNRIMQVTYAFAGFRQVALRDDIEILEADLNQIQPYPDYVHVCNHVTTATGGPHT